MKLENNDQSFKVHKIGEMDVHFGCINRDIKNIGYICQTHSYQDLSTRSEQILNKFRYFQIQTTRIHRNVFRLTGNRVGKKLSSWEGFSLICALEYSQIHAKFVGIHSVRLLIRHTFLSIARYLISYDGRIYTMHRFISLNVSYIFMNTIIICPKEMIHFSNEFFSSRVSKYPSSFSFISKEKGFSFFLPGDRPKPGIRRRYSAHFSYWRDTRG